MSLKDCVKCLLFCFVSFILCSPESILQHLWECVFSAPLAVCVLVLSVPVSLFQSAFPPQQKKTYKSSVVWATVSLLLVSLFSAGEKGFLNPEIINLQIYLFRFIVGK